MSESNERQQARLMAQLSQKRALKQKYLYSSGEETPGSSRSSALKELVLSNLMLQAIKGRKDIFGAAGPLWSKSQHLYGAPLDVALNWIGELAEALDCSVYELMIDDEPKRRKIVYQLLANLKRDDVGCWEDIRIEPDGNASFALPHFDYFYRMTDQPSANVSLVFRKISPSGGACRYRLTIEHTSPQAPDGPIPGGVLLWEEADGGLKDFTEQAIADLNGGWMLLQEGFAHRREQLRGEAAKLKDLCAVLEEGPEGLNCKTLLEKEKQLLTQLREEEKSAYDRMPPSLKRSSRGAGAENCLLLLGGAIRSLDRAVAALSAPEQSQQPIDCLSEAAYLLESAGEPV